MIFDGDPEMDAKVDLVARHSLRGSNDTVTVTVSGRLSKPTIEFSSSAPCGKRGSGHRAARHWLDAPTARRRTHDGASIARDYELPNRSCRRSGFRVASVSVWGLRSDVRHSTRPSVRGRHRIRHRRTSRVQRRQRASGKRTDPRALRRRPVRGEARRGRTQHDWTGTAARLFDRGALASKLCNDRNLRSAFQLEHRRYLGALNRT